MSKNTDRPAFPLPVGDQECCGRFKSGYGGMSLRDYFAAKALQGLLSGRNYIAETNVRLAYEYADAMLKEREK